MTQDAIVFKNLPDGMAQVVVMRGTACGSSCSSCEACVFQSELTAEARNLIGAKPGQKVVIESKSSRVYGAILLVYILPLVLAIAGYAAAYLLGAGEGVCIAVTFLGFILGGVVVVLSQRLKKDKEGITFDIVQFQ